jgi:ribonucleotide reductase beta subunit family protein with ferritin-like domain
MDSSAGTAPKETVGQLAARISALHCQAAPGMLRYSLFPIQDEKSYEFYKRQEAASWVADELDFRRDLEHYEAASPAERRLIDTILAFFLPGDGLISMNLIRFLLECRSYEDQAMLVAQLHIELVHAETYSLAALTFVRSPDKLNAFVSQAESTACVRAKAAFMERWMNSDAPRSDRLLAFACAEGIFFCSLFAVIFWFRPRGKFPNFITANQLILRDEALHRDFGCYLYLKEGKSPRALEIVREAVAIEDDFINHMLPEPVEDLNAADMRQYVRFIADQLLGQIGEKPDYEVSNPLGFMKSLVLEGKTNYYEQRVSQYSRTDLKASLDWRKRAGLTQAGATVDLYTNPEDLL